jgi:hypothetical protein
MKRIIPLLVAILLGLSVGWYFGYTRPVAQNQRKLLKEYQSVRDALHATDGEMAHFGGRLPEYWDAVKRQEEFAAGIALGVFFKLEKGNVEGAKSNLATTVAIYYRGHRHDGDTNFLARIERIASTNAAISNAIYRKLERD